MCASIQLAYSQAKLRYILSTESSDGTIAYSYSSIGHVSDTTYNQSSSVKSTVYYSDDSFSSDDTIPYMDLSFEIHHDKPKQSQTKGNII